MQPPKVNDRLPPAALTEDVKRARMAADGPAETESETGGEAAGDTGQPASGAEAGDTARNIADGQDKVVGEALTRLPPG